MRAGDVLGVQPNVVGCRRVEGQAVVLVVVLADEDALAVLGHEAKGSGGLVLPLFFRALLEEAALNQLIFDLFDFGQCRGGGEGAFDAGEIADVFLAECDLPVEQLLRTLELVVLVVERLHVLTERQSLVEFQRDLFARFAVDVVDGQRGVGVVFVEMRVRHEIVTKDFVVLGVFRLAKLFLQDAELVFGTREFGLDEFLQAIFFGRRVGSRKLRGLFEHRADRGKGELRAFCREVMERKGRGREHLAVLVKGEAGRRFFLYAGSIDFSEGALQRFLVLCVQVGAAHLLGQSGRKDGLAGAHRAEAQTDVQKSFAERRFRILCEAFDDDVGLHGAQVELFLSGRRRVFACGQNEARAAVRAADFLESVDDDAVLHEDDVAVLADELDDERLRDDLAAGREGVEVEAEDAVERVLADVGDAASFELLAQNHAEERRFSWILRWLRREEDGACLRACRDVQQVIPAGLAYAQEDGGFRRLRDLVDASA